MRSGSKKAVPTAKTWIIGCALKPRSLQPRRGNPAAPSLRRTKRAVEVKKPTQTALLTKVDFRPSAHPYHQLAAVNLRR